MDNRVVKFLGSLKLAVFLLVTLAVVLAGGTFYESSTSSKAALVNVYRTWWFNGLLALLAVNLTASALTRWPWKRRHIGFVITHGGIIVLLGGCSAAFHYGTEGMMELHEGRPPSSTVRLDDEALTVVEPSSGQRSKTLVRVRKNGTIMPRAIQVSNNLRLSLDEFLPNTRIARVVSAGGTEPNPALRFRLQSEVAQQNVSDWLVANSPEQSRMSLGPANVQFVVARDAEELKRLTTAASVKPRIEIGDFKFDVAENLNKPLALGDRGLNATIMGYWPDFRLDENHKPTSVSDEPNNPATVVIVSRGDQDEQRYFVFADPQMQPIIRTTRGKPIDLDVRLSAGNQQRGSAGLTVALGPDHKLYYAANAKGGFKSGVLEIGKPISPGWMDFQFTAEEFVPNAVMSEKIVTAPGESQFPAVRVTAHAGASQQSQPVRYGEPTVIEIDGKLVHVMYSSDTMQVPFTVKLENFEVQRDEGSDNIAGWTSHVVFEDAQRGLSQRAAIWMNHPASFEGYKFSQASWNPNDLQFTVLQVKKDPQFVTWLTWIGAALITAGIALMFWFRRWFRENGEDGESAVADRKPRQMATVAILFVFLFCGGAIADDLDFSALRYLAVYKDVRKKPLDTVAIETLQKISGKRVFTDTQSGRKMEPMDVLLSMWLETRDWSQTSIVLLNYRPLKEQLGLPVEQTLFSYKQLATPKLRGILATVQGKEDRNENLTREEREAKVLSQRLTTLMDVVGPNALAVVPPPTAKDKWVSIADYNGEKQADVQKAFQSLGATYVRRDPEAFATASREFSGLLRSLNPSLYPSIDSLRREVHYNSFHPFRKAVLLYAIAFVWLLATWRWRQPTIYWTGVAAFVAGVGVHAYAFYLRIMISGRPPVTNMYESVVWVSCIAALFALILECVYRQRYYIVGVAPLSIVLLILADQFPAVLDSSIGPLTPVLRDNFWLSVHVPTVTAGYAAFFVTLGVGHIALGYYLFAPQAKAKIARLETLVYRAMQIGVLLIAAGTILGGIWAHYAWGRFWGWDPKEVWALITLLCYLVPLHGRLAGWMTDFALSVSSVVCFLPVLMAWYGVNFVLGKGLHSYGFGVGGYWYALAFVAIELTFVGAATLRRGRTETKVAELTTV